MAERLRRLSLLALEAFTGVGAVAGGIGLLAGRLGMSDSLLQGSPFSDYTLPGLALIVGVGATNLVAAALVRAGRKPHGALASLAAGAALFVFEVAAIGWQMFLQPVCFVISLVIAGLALAELRADPASSTPRKQLVPR